MEERLVARRLARPLFRTQSAILGVALIFGVLAHGASQEEALFLAANKAAMVKMMADMSVASTGDVDADFAATMIPHHQGAIEMAQAELRYGRNERLRRIAQEIIVTQQQEIEAMKYAIREASR